jgi:hypothetical protein
MWPSLVLLPCFSPTPFTAPFLPPAVIAHKDLVVPRILYERSMSPFYRSFRHLTPPLIILGTVEVH